MRAKKTQMLLDNGCIIIEANDLTTVLKDKNGNVATVDEWGKVTWRVYNIPKEGTTNEIQT